MESHRQPLEPVNPTMDSTSWGQTKQIVMIAGGSEKENGNWMCDSVAVLQRKERLRVERLKTEEFLKGRERELERGIRELEKRNEELRKLELEMRKLMINAKSRQFSEKVSKTSYSSLFNLKLVISPML